MATDPSTRCKAKTNAGAPCGWAHQLRSEFCWRHDPTISEETKTRMRQLTGKKGGSVLKLEKAVDIIRWVERTAGELDQKDGWRKAGAVAKLAEVVLHAQAARRAEKQETGGIVPFGAAS